MSRDMPCSAQTMYISDRTRTCGHVIQLEPPLHDLQHSEMNRKWEKRDTVPIHHEGTSLGKVGPEGPVEPDAMGAQGVHRDPVEKVNHAPQGSMT